MSSGLTYSAPSSFSPGMGSGGTPSPLSLIEQYESGGNNVENYAYGPSSTASGYYQITNSTWNGIAAQSGLPTVGPGTNFANVMALPQETQTAGAAALYNAEGFTPWANYNPSLANAIASYGGASAFPGTTSASSVSGSGYAASSGAGASSAAGTASSGSLLTSPLSTLFGWIGNYFERGAIILLGVVILGIALWALVKDTAAGKAVRRGAGKVMTVAGEAA